MSKHKSEQSELNASLGNKLKQSSDLITYLNYIYKEPKIIIPENDSFLKKLVDINKTRFYNHGSIHLYDEHYINIYRRTGTHINIIPGNDEKCESNICPNRKPFGKYFWWNNWHNTTLGIDILTYENKNLQKENIIYIDDYLPNEDSRIIKEDARYFYVYNPEVTYIIKFEFNINEEEKFKIVKIIIRYGSGLKENNQSVIKITDDFIDYFDWFYNDGVHIYRYLLKEITPNNSNYGIIFKKTLSAPSYDFFKNIPLYQMDEKQLIVIPINSLYKILGESPVIFNSRSKKDIEYYKKKIVIDNANIEKEKKEIGNNFDIMPFFSFSTPAIKIPIMINEKQMYLGLGHLKIHSDNKRFLYKDGSNIQMFRDNLYKDYNAKFGDKYIKAFGSSTLDYGEYTDVEKIDPRTKEDYIDMEQRFCCDGYIYMGYFYLVSDDYKEMLLSDAFLPLNMDAEYKFSLFFPISIDIILKDNIYYVNIGAGEGDYYSVELTFLLNEVITMCIHNISNLDMTNFKYYILTKINDKIIMTEKISSIMSGGNRSNGLYKLKYITCKNEYLNLRHL